MATITDTSGQPLLDTTGQFLDDGVTLMARTIIPLQQPGTTGLTPAYATPDTVNGNMYNNGDGDTIMYVKNGNAASLTVTFRNPTSNAIDGQQPPDATVSIPTGQERVIRKPLSWNQPASSTDAGYVYVDWSVSSSVSVAVYT